MARSRFVGVAYAWGLTVMLAAGAHASTVCDVYQDLARFGTIARSLFKAGMGGNLIGCRIGAVFETSVCTSRAKLTNAEINNFGPPLENLVATAASGTAVALKHREAAEPCGDTKITGNVITGGGEVRMSGGFPPDIEGVVDTSGTSPLVSSCSGAMVDMVDISNGIAGSPAVLTLESLTVRVNETIQLDVPPGGGIVRIGRLALQGNGGLVMGGYNYECLYSPGGIQSAVLEIRPFTNDDIVLDVGELSIGACAYIDMPSDNFLINVAGTGRKVKIGVDSYGNYPVNVLAPERTVRIAGENAGEFGTEFGFIWADKVIAKGYNFTPVVQDCD